MFTLINWSSSYVVKGQCSVHVIDVVEKVEELQVVIFADTFIAVLEPRNLNHESIRL